LMSGVLPIEPIKPSRMSMDLLRAARREPTISACLE
jgi:hypothetical protein